jgi:hypothetical protein
LKKKAVAKTTIERCWICRRLYDVKANNRRLKEMDDSRIYGDILDCSMTKEEDYAAFSKNQLEPEVLGRIDICVICFRILTSVTAMYLDEDENRKYLEDDFIIPIIEKIMEKKH